MSTIFSKTLIAGTLMLASVPLSSGQLHADEYQKGAVELHLESGMDAYYTKYNFDKTRDENDVLNGEGYALMSGYLTLDARRYLSDSVYLAPFVSINVIHDFNDRSWNRSYWNNNQVFGAGLKITKEFSFENKAQEWVGGMNMSAFAQYELMTSSFDRSKDPIPSSVDKQNLKSGVNLWLERREKLDDLFSVWTEHWGELAWNSTAFSDKGQDNFLLGTLSSKIGVGIDLGAVSLEPYFKADVVNDFLGRSWNKVSWYNNVLYGPGVRLALGKVLPGTVSIYAEYLKVDYFNDQQERTDDVRAGLTFWIPLY
ncbi:hypothetical protein [Chlorobium phaeovibrioides]|uniref:hypothetical protein n=1 Tax=Chlorobium phaeovibrioides TaxID=1094 RepID=UPI0012308429|nr:hypothetical protein [Chlorobium phaeovibrioides]QEQ56981.1 hypothetical protein FNV82_04780 [Chlorobium phaeovibrioides]